MTLWGAFALPAIAQVRTTFTNDIALSDRSPIEVALYLISWFLGILALIAVVLVLYGGFVWMFSQGNEEKIEKAKLILKNAAIGLLIIMAAWGIVLYFLNVLGNATGTDLGGGPGSGCDSCSFGNPSGSSDFYVLATVPDAGETDASLCAIQVRMSMDVDQSTVTTDSMTLRVAAGAQNGASCTENAGCASGLCTESVCVGDTVAGTIGFGPGDTTPNFVFLPNADLETSTTYEATVEGGPDGVRSNEPTPDDSIDNRLAMTSDYTWTFTTGTERDSTPPTVQITPSSPFPADGETNVCTNTPINFDFSEAMLITSFNDTQSFVVDAAGTPSAPVAPDWVDTVPLRNWNFGGNFDFAQARPRTALSSFSLYSARLYAGDPVNDFVGAVTDLCGNPLDGETPPTIGPVADETGDGVAEGDPIDNFYGHEPATPEDPITWETGDNAECTPVINSITQAPPNYYGEYAGLRDGEACAANTDCASNSCVSGQCVGYGDTNVTITGLYLIPHPEVQFEGSVLWAGDGFNTCFDEELLGNVVTNTGVGDSCIDDAIQESGELELRLVVGTETNTPVSVRVAGETSEPSTDRVAVESPHIDFIDPSNGAVGQYITISGASFGESNGTVLMRSADGVRESTLTLPEACGDVWADAEIVAIAPATYTDTTTGETGNWEEEEIGYIQVVVAASGKRSNLVQFTFSDVVRPNLCAVEPQCQNAVGVPFTATGENFGDTQGGSDIFFASAPETGFAGNISQWDDTAIEGSTDTDMSIDQEYWVTVFDAETELSSNGRTYDIVCEDAPQVVNITTCDPPNGIYASPSPRPNVENACINGMVGILFDQQMNTSTFQNNSTVYFKQYNTGGAFNANYSPISVTGHFETTNWNVVLGDNSYYGFQYDIDQSFSDPEQDSAPNDPSTYLQPNTWYQLTITTGVQSTAGVPMTEPYTLTFKTNNSAAPCSIDSVDLSPSVTIKNTFPDEEDYTASAYDAACNLLDPNSYTWSWGSSNTNVGNFGTGPSSTNNETVYVAGNDIINQGVSTITAAADSEQDAASFTVDFGYCTNDADCTDSCAGSTCNLTTSHCTPVINNATTPDPTNGDNGTWVTINGCMFGPERGNVFWANPNYSTVTDWPDEALCGDTWTINQIIAEVPDTREDGTPLDNSAHTIQVESTYGDTDTSTSTFTINDIVRPGLCRIQPNAAEEQAEVVATGQNLGNAAGFASYLSALDSEPTPANALDRLSATTVTTWNASTINSDVPAGAIGTAYLATIPSTSTYANTSEGFRGITAGGDPQCVNEDFCTNALNFNVQCQNDYGCGTGCCADAGYCQPAEACNTCTSDTECVASGQCTGSTCVNGQCTPVINSLYFDSGPLTAPVTIDGCYFGTYRPNDSSVTFDGIVANLLCTTGWSNNQIVVEVPNNSVALPVGSTADVVVNNNIGSSNTEIFTISAQCFGGGPVPTGGHPLLCDLDPSTGTAATTASAGDTINFVGDNFTNTQTDVFNENKVGNNFNYSNEQSTFAQVPLGALTGAAYSNVSSCYSNGLDFGVACETDGDCADNYLCVDGICTDATCGFCSTANPEPVCGDSNGCYYNTTTQLNCCAPWPVLKETQPDNATPELCPNSSFDLYTTEAMSGQEHATIEVIDVGATLPSPLSSYVPPATENVVATIEMSTTINNQLQTDGTYLTRLDLKAPFPGTATGDQEDYLYRWVIPSDTSSSSTDVISSSTGLHLEDGTEQVYFTVKANDCLPNYLEVLNDETQQGSFVFNEQNQSTSFTVTMYADDSTPLVTTSTMAWSYSWNPYADESCSQVAWVELPEASTVVSVGGGPAPSPTAETQTVTSGTINDGAESITVTAVPTAGWTGTLTDDAPVTTFFCDPDDVWVYNDTDQNMQLIYCVDEDAPRMPATPAINSNPTATGADWFRQYLFTNPDDEAQAFGIRVYENSAHRTPEEWYNTYVPNPGNPQSVLIDGYEAVRDGNSYYISAPNIVNAGGMLYNNIYLFTFNDNDATNAIKEQLLQFIRFNTNVSVSGCEGSDKAKLTRDTKRVNDVWRISRLADTYESTNGDYPLPESEDFGSFISTFTTSVWPSWQGALGNLLGETLPSDPYNFFSAQPSDQPWNETPAPWNYTGPNTTLENQDCGYNPDQNIYFDESGTCWDPVNNEFQCPANSHVYLWEIESGVAKLYTNLEYENPNTQDYKDSATINEYYAITTDPCNNITNASCSCVNYELTSEFGWDQRP